MKIKVAGNAGFCMGVTRAVDLALATVRANSSKQVFTYGQLIHNPQTVELLRKRGVIPIDDIDALPAEGNKAVLVVRAHGISPSEHARIMEKGVQIVDATCPRVRKVQAIVRKHSRLGYDIVVIGDVAHPEVNAILGYVEGRGFVVGSLEEVQSLPPLAKICVVSQTTCSTEDYKDIVAQLRSISPAVVAFDTICDSTEQRQAEVREMARMLDVIIVVGGKNSANTCRLTRIAAEEGALTFHIESEKELADISLRGNAKVGIVAGASTPHWVLDRVISALNRKAVAGNKIGSMFLKMVNSLVKTDIITILGALVLGLVGATLQHSPLAPAGLVAGALFIFASHTIIRISSRVANSSVGLIREEAYAGRRVMFLSAGFISLSCALFLSYRLGAAPFFVLLAITGAGLVYNILHHLPRLYNITALAKVPIVALVWAILLTWLPVGREFVLSWTALGSGMVIFSLVLLRLLIADARETQSDAIVGKTTLPVVLGRRKTKILTGGICVSMILALLLSAFSETTRALLALPFFYLWICENLYVSRRREFTRELLEAVWDFAYLIASLYVVFAYAS